MLPEPRAKEEAVWISLVVKACYASKAERCAHIFLVKRVSREKRKATGERESSMYSRHVKACYPMKRKDMYLPHCKSVPLEWKGKLVYLSHPYFNLRSKRSPTRRTWAARRSFSHSGRAKNGKEQKGGRSGVGEVSEGNACPQTSQFWKRPPTAHRLFTVDFTQWLTVCHWVSQLQITGCRILLPSKQILHVSCQTRENLRCRRPKSEKLQANAAEFVGVLSSLNSEQHLNLVNLAIYLYQGLACFIMKSLGLFTVKIVASGVNNIKCDFKAAIKLTSAPSMFLLYDFRLQYAQPYFL